MPASPGRRWASGRGAAPGEAAPGVGGGSAATPAPNGQPAVRLALAVDMEACGSRWPGVLREPREPPRCAEAGAGTRGPARRRPGPREPGSERGLAAFSSHGGCWLLFNIPTHVSVCLVNRSDCERQAAVLSPLSKANILPAYGLKSLREIGHNKQTNNQTTTKSSSVLSGLSRPHPHVPPRRLQPTSQARKSAARDAAAGAGGGPAAGRWGGRRAADCDAGAPGAAPRR